MRWRYVKLADQLEAIFEARRGSTGNLCMMSSTLERVLVAVACAVDI